MANYKAQYPGGVEVDAGVIRFLEEFYQVSDTPGAHDAYVDQFTTDATFKLASKTSTGRDEITTLRHGMWTAVSQRKHTIHKVFPFGSASDEFMLYGDVEYELRAGGKSTVEWAGRAQIEKGTDGKYRMKFYQVYLDTGATAKK